MKLLILFSVLFLMGCETAMKRTFDRSELFESRTCNRIAKLSEQNKCMTGYEMVGQLTVPLFDGREVTYDLCCPEVDYFGN